MLFSLSRRWFYRCAGLSLAVSALIADKRTLLSIFQVSVSSWHDVGTSLVIGAISLESVPFSKSTSDHLCYFGTAFLSLCTQYEVTKFANS
jgi:hypothetical protein